MPPILSTCPPPGGAAKFTPDLAMRMRKKVDLPSKPCVRCGRPFTWRKKWEQVWGEVKFCSDRCREAKAQPERPVPPATQPAGRPRR